MLRITDADPIEHELLFERFLNPARREMPDVDIDFCSARRDEVIEFIYERFGHDRVAMVATVNTMHAPSAVRVVAKAFDFRPDEVDRLSTKVPWGSAAKLGEMLAERPELADHEFQHPHYRRLVHLAERLADYPAHLGTHLGGFILSRDPLTDRVPLQWAAKGVVVAQFDKDDVETLGLVKMDILALKMHSAIAEAVRRVEERTGVQVSPWELPRDDPAVYELIRAARTVGVFQLESAGQRNLATRLREKDFEDVIAAISLFRPGPLQAEMIGPFIRRRHGREAATVPHPAMWPVLKRTYGVILYQEQVIEVAAAVAGFSLAEGDLLRRAMTHERSMEEMDEIGRGFVEKAVARGVERATAEEVFRQLRGFAAYGFNKAHAACFAIVCNASAWLKAHYPAEFYCGLLNNQPMGFYSPRVVLNDARRWGLRILPLDVNLSQKGFSVEDEGRALRVGLKYAKEMSTAAVRAIVREQPFIVAGRLHRPHAREPRDQRQPGARGRLRRLRHAARGAARPSAAALRRRGGRLSGGGGRRLRPRPRPPPQTPASCSRAWPSASSSRRWPSSPRGRPSSACKPSSRSSASTSASTHCSSCAASWPASRRCLSAVSSWCPTGAACCSAACSSAPRCPGSAPGTAPCSSPSRTRRGWRRWWSSTTSTSSTDACSRRRPTCSSRASCRTARSTAWRWWRTRSSTWSRWSAAPASQRWSPARGRGARGESHV